MPLPGKLIPRDKSQVDRQPHRQKSSPLSPPTIAAHATYSLFKLNFDLARAPYIYISRPIPPSASRRNLDPKPDQLSCTLVSLTHTLHGLRVQGYAHTKYTVHCKLRSAQCYCFHSCCCCPLCDTALLLLVQEMELLLLKHSSSLLKRMRIFAGT